MIHIVPFLEGGLIFFSLEFFLFKPQWLFYVIGAISLFIILGFLVPKQRFLSGKEFWHYLVIPLIFVWSAAVLLLFLENIYFKHFFVLGTGIYIIFYFENLFYYLISGKDGSDNAFLRMANQMNVISIFFLSAGFYGIKTFIQLPIWLLAIIFNIFSSGLVYASLWSIKHNLKEIYAEVLIMPLIITELFLAINFLPIGFYTGGAMVGIIYYVMAGVLFNFVKNKDLVYKRYVIVGAILLLLVVATARWV